METFDRPFDFLNNSKNKSVILFLKNGKSLTGILQSFDIHLNIVLSEMKELNAEGKLEKSFGYSFIRGDFIIFISPAK